MSVRQKSGLDSLNPNQINHIMELSKDHHNRCSLCIAAHVDTGKTTFTEVVVHRMGISHSINTVNEGTTVTDFDPDEKARGITVGSATISSPYKSTITQRERIIYLIDTPGHVDFSASRNTSFKVTDNVIILADSAVGPQAQTTAVYRESVKHGASQMLFINKMDKADANFDESLESCKRKLNINPIIIAYPIGQGGTYTGNLDLVHNKVFYWEHPDRGIKIGKGGIDCGNNTSMFIISIEEALSYGIITETHKQISIDLRDILLTELSGLIPWFNDSDMDTLSILKALRDVVLAKSAIPTMCGSAYKNIGIDQALDFVCDIFPSPREKNKTVQVYDSNRNDIELQTIKDERLSALIFKMQDLKKTLGTLAFIKIFSGVIKVGQVLWNNDMEKSFKVNNLFLINANKYASIPEAYPGMIVGVGIRGDECFSGNSLSGDKRDPLFIKGFEIPDPVISITISPETKGDLMKLGDAIKSLQKEDPSLRLKQSNRDHEFIIEGLGELHLEIATDKIKRDFGVPLIISPVRIAYKQTIEDGASIHHRHIKQSGGHGQFAVMDLEITPKNENRNFDVDKKRIIDLGNGVTFINKITEGRIDTSFIPGIEEGIKEAVRNGVNYGIPLVDMDIFLIDGSYHSVDSSKEVFQMAARNAMRELVQKANPYYIEPIMLLTVEAEAEYTSNIIADICRRNGEVKKQEHIGNSVQVISHVPLASLAGADSQFISDLRSITSGSGIYTQEQSHYKRAINQSKVVNDLSEME